MKAICIDGTPNTECGFSLPEFVPLEVRHSTKYQDCFSVKGYETAVMENRVYWHKRRFIPLSNIDETELIKEREQILTQ